MIPNCPQARPDSGARRTALLNELGCLLRLLLLELVRGRELGSAFLRRVERNLDSVLLGLVSGGDLRELRLGSQALNAGLLGCGLQGLDLSQHGEEGYNLEADFGSMSGYGTGAAMKAVGEVVEA